MGRFTYYSPLLVGIGLVLVLQGSLRENPPDAFSGSPWLYVVLLAIGAAGVCQLLMLGAQGAFAQVLPGPGGRSIRGGGAVLSGGALLCCAALLPIAMLLFSEGLAVGGWVILVLALALALVSILAYVWAWPTADRDFADR